MPLKQRFGQMQGIFLSFEWNCSALNIWWQRQTEFEKPLEWKLQIENRVGLLTFALTGFGKMTTELILAARYRGRKPLWFFQLLILHTHFVYSVEFYWCEPTKSAIEISFNLSLNIIHSKSGRLHYLRAYIYCNTPNIVNWLRETSFCVIADQQNEPFKHFPFRSQLSSSKHTKMHPILIDSVIKVFGKKIFRSERIVPNFVVHSRLVVFFFSLFLDFSLSL